MADNMEPLLMNSMGPKAHLRKEPPAALERGRTYCTVGVGNTVLLRYCIVVYCIKQD